MRAAGAVGSRPAAGFTSGPAGIDPTFDGSDDVDVLIVGGGVSGLAAAFWLRRLAPGLRLLVLEASESPGGKVRTLGEDGFLVDTGPGTLTLGAPGTDDLIAALGLEAAVIESPAAARRFLVKRGRLVPVPSSPGSALKSPLISAAGKLRALLEPMVPRGSAADESVHAFLARRFGPEAARTFGEALVSGIVAGDPHGVSIRAVLPQLFALERRYGSVLRGMVVAKRSGAGSGRRAVTLAGGMGTLTSALADSVGPSLKAGTGVTSLAPVPDGYRATTSGGDSVVARAVVLATPSDVAAGLLEPIDGRVAKELEAIEYVEADVIALGYEAHAVTRPLDGFGFIAPRGQGVRSLGVLNASGLHPGVAPPRNVLFRAIAGGALDAGFGSLSVGEKVGVVRRDLQTTLGITAEPTFERVVSWRRAIPQYAPGHLERIGRIEAAMAGHPRLSLLGNAYRGVGVADCLREARALAERLAKANAEARGRAANQR